MNDAPERDQQICAAMKITPETLRNARGEWRTNQSIRPILLHELGRFVQEEKRKLETCDEAALKTVQGKLKAFERAVNLLTEP